MNDPTPEIESVLRPGETCWRVETADRVAFCIDGEAFFGAVADAIENARESVWLLGWDFHSAVQLRRPPGSEGRAELVSLLDARVREVPSLHAHVLAWDFAMLYALEREFLPLLQFGARTHRRIHFAMDAAHPLTASHHQKLVVVDDAIAFVGGFDLTAHRWDTRDHTPGDPRRTTPSGKAYQPFHDVQIAVDGDAAAALGVLARERWTHATGRKVDARTRGADPWPTTLEPALRKARIGIARTFPAFGGRPEVREVEALYRASIGAARRWIYVENQYLTAPPVVEWLADRLREPDGPEVVILAPEKNSGWLERSTMGTLRARAVRALRAADPTRDRLRIVFPHRDGLGDDEIINVHAKLMVVDDHWARVGSSNLSNRSLGLDSECDLVVEAREEDDTRAIARFRNDLLAEHLGTSVERVALELERTGSLVRTVDALSGAATRTLRPLDVAAAAPSDEVLDAIGAIDPEHPAPLEELVARFEEESETAPGRRRASRSRVIVPIAVVAAIALTWQVTPLGDFVTGDRLAGLVGRFRGDPLTSTAAFALACLALVPITALTVAVGLSFDPLTAFGIAWAGGVVSAILGHAAGRHLWRDAVRRLADDRLNELSRRLGRRGIVSSALLQSVPIAPFMVVNLVAGASRVSARDFGIGTALGLFPGTVVLVVGAAGIRTAWSQSVGPAWLWVGLAVLAVVGGVAALRRILRRIGRNA